MPEDVSNLKTIAAKGNSGTLKCLLFRENTFLPTMVFICLSIIFSFSDIQAGGFSDDHDDNSLTGWTIEGYRDWSEIGGYVLPADADSNQGFLINNYNCDPNGTFTATINITGATNSRYGGIVFRYTNTSNYYFLIIYEQNASGTAANNAVKVVSNSTDWGAAALFQVSNLNFSGFNSFYTVKIEMSGPNFTIYLNDVLLGSFSDNTHSTGKVGYGYHSTWNRYLQYGSSSWADLVSDYTWDTNTSAGILAGNGTWGTDNYWTRTSGDGRILESWPGAGSSATFAGADLTYTITINGTQNVDSLTFINSGYTLSSGTLNFGTKPGIFVAAGKSATISAAVTGSPGVSKYGTGTLTLSGNNTYSGATVINAGTISVGVLANGGSSSNLGSSSSSAANLVFLGGTLNYTGTGHSTDRRFTIGAGGGTLISSGSGALNLTNTGSVAFNGAGNRTLTLSGTHTGNNILAASVSNNGGNATSITKSGSGRWVLTGNNSATGTVTISGGTLQIGNGGTSGSIAGNVTNGGHLVFNRSNSYTYGGVISSTGAVTKNGAGTLILSGTNAYTGNTTVSNGTLIVTGATAAGSTINVSSGATLGGTGTVNGTVNIASGAYLSPGNGGTGTLSTGTLTLGGTSVLNFKLGTSSDRVNVTGNLTLDGTLNITGAAGFTTGNYTIMTCTGSLTNNILSVGSVPSGYNCSITASGGNVIATISVGTVRTVDADGGADYTSLDAALNDIAGGLDIDTIKFVGSDVDTFTWSTYLSQSIGTITFKGTKSDPDSFPVIIHSNHSTYNFFNVTNGRFERVVISGPRGLNMGQSANTHEFINCVFRDITSTNEDPYAVHVEGITALRLVNCLFEGNTCNNVISINPWGGNPAVTITNCTFDNNTSVFSADPGGSIANFSFINNIFSGNTTTFRGNNLRGKTTYSLTSEDITGYGTGCISNSNPQYHFANRNKPSDWRIADGSPGDGIGTTTGAPSTDIAGQARGGSIDAGCWNSAAPPAKDYFWDVSTSPGIQAGNGTWGTNNYWTINGTTLVSWPGSGYSAIFGGSNGNYTITVNGTQYVDSITFLNSNYYLTGGTIDLGSQSGIYVESGERGEINSIIAGTAGIKLYGTGELSLSGNNTFTGASAVYEGSLRLIHPNALGATSGATTINSGASIQLSGNTTFAAERLYVTGSGSGTGVLRTVVDGVNDNSVWQGRITLQGNSSFGASETNDRITISGVVEGAFKLTKVGPGTITLSGTNTFSGGLAVEEGILRAGNSQALGNFGNAINIANGAAIDVNGINLQGYTQNIIINGQRNGSNGAIINSGGEQQNAIRKISLGSNASIGGNGNRFDIGRGYSGSVCITGNNHILTKVGSNYMALLADADGLAGVVVNSGTLSLEADAAAGNAPITINNGAILASYENRTFSNNISINDGGTLHSSLYNAYTTVHNGSITLTGNTNIGNPVASTMIISGAIGGTGNVNFTGATGTVILANNNNYSGGTTISSGTLQIGNGGTTGSITGNVTNNGTLRFNRSDDMNFGGVISGTGAVVQSGEGNLTLSGANTYSGLTTVSPLCTLIVAHNTALGTTAGGTVLEAGGGQYSTSLRLANGVTITGETVTLNSNISGDARSAIEVGNGNTATWNGTVILAGNNRTQLYANGTMNINGPVNGSCRHLLLRGYGTGNINSSINIGNTTLLKTDGSTWNINTTGNTWGNTQIAVGTLKLGVTNAMPSATIITMGQNDALSAAFDLNGKNQTISGLMDGGSTGGTKRITNSGTSAATLTINNTSDFTYSYLIQNSSNPLNLIKSGNGTLTLAGTNTYTGTTTVSGGTLNVTGSLASGSAVTVTGTLAGNGTVAGTVNASNGTIAPGNNGTGTLNTGALILNGSSKLNFELGSSSDRIAVNGNLTLDGTLNVTNLAGFGEGNYVIMTYTGSLTNNTLDLGTMPGSYQYAISTATSNQVILQVTSTVQTYTWDVSTSAGIQADDGTWGINNFWTLNGTSLVAWPGSGNNARFKASGGGSGGDGYSDDHDDGALTGWTVAGGRTWSESGGNALPQHNNGDQGFLINNYDCADNGTFNATIVLSSDYEWGSKQGGLVYRYTNTGSFYFLCINFYEEKLEIYKDNLSADISTQLATFPIPGFASYNYIYPVKIEMSGSNFSFYVGSNLVGTLNDASHSSGKVGYTHNTQYQRCVSFGPSSWQDASSGGGPEPPYLITVNSTQSVDTIFFDDNGFTLSSGTVNLTGATPVIVTNGKAVVGSIISGSSGLRKNGNDTLVLTGSNSWTGASIVNAGVLQIGNNSASGVLPASITNNATIVFNRSNSYTYGNVISGTGAVIKQGASTLTLTGDNTWSGITTISAGTLQLGSGGTSGSISNSSNVTNNSAFAVNRSDEYTYSGVISGSGTLTKSGTGKFILTGANTYTGVTTISGGTLQIGDGGTTGAISNSSNVTNNAALIFDRSNVYTYSGVISGTGTVTKNGAGALTIRGSNTYTGVTTVNSGTLVVGNGGSFYNGGSVAGSIVINAGATMRIDRQDMWGVHTSVPSATVTINEGGTLISNGYFNVLGPVNINGGTLSSNGGADFWDTWSLHGTVTTGGTARSYISTAGGSNNSVKIGNATAGGTTTFNVGEATEGVDLEVSTIVIDDKSSDSPYPSVASGLIKSGAGTMALTSANTYTGLTRINAGTITVSSLADGGTASNIGSSSNDAANLVFNGGTLQYTGAAQSSDRLFTLRTGGGAIDASGTGALVLNNTGSAVINGTGTRTLTLTGTNTEDNILAAMIANDASSNATSITKSGDGKWILTGDNTATGTVTISAGTLQIGNNGTTGSIAGNTNNSGSLIFYRSNSLTYNGAVSGTGSLTKMGAGTLTLGGSSSYTGATVINGGTISVSSLANGGSNSNIGAASSDASNLIIDGGTLRYTGSDASSNRLFTIGTGGAVINASGSGAINWTSTGIIERSGSGTRTLTLTGSNTGTNTLAAIIADDASSNATSLVKTGNGSWTLSAVNSYTGTTTVSAGTLVVTGLIASGSDVTVNGGTLAGTGAAAGPVNASNGKIAPGVSAAGTLTTGSLTLNGSSVLEFELGTSRDSIKVIGDLVLDGTLNVTELAGFGVGTYYLITYTGNLTNQGLVTGSMPDGYTYNIVAGSGSVRLIVSPISYDYFWDVSADAGFQAGDGTWGTDDYWSTDGTTLVSWPGAGYSATFAGQDGTYTVTVSGTQNVDSIAILNSGYTLTGGTIHFGTKNGIYMIAGKSATISSVITGTGGLKLYSPGTGSRATLNLEGSNTFTGATNISQYVRLNVPILANGGLNSSIGRSSNAASNLIIDGGQLRHTGAAASTDRLFTLTDKGGYVFASGSGPLNFTNTGSIAVTGAGTPVLEIGGVYEGASVFAPVIVDGAGTVSVLKSGPVSTWILTGNNTYTGVTTVREGTLQVGNGGTSGSITGDIVNRATLVFNRSNAYSYYGIISDTGAVIQSGSGTLTLEGINTYTGKTVINSGTLSVAYLDNGGTNSNIGASSNDAANLVINGGSFRYTGAGQSSDRLFTLGAGGGSIDASGTGGLNLNNSGTMGISGTGTRTLTLTGTNTGDNILAVAVINDLSSNATSIVKSGTGKWILTGDNTATGTVTLSSGTLQIGNAGTTGSISGNVSNSANLVFNRSDSYSYNGSISGSGSVSQNGLGTLILSGTNSYTGITAVNDGILSVSSMANGGSNSNIGASSSAAGNLVINRGTLKYTGGAQSSNRLFTIGVNGATIDASGTGALNLTNTGTYGRSGTGTRTLTLTGSNTGNNTLAGVIANDASSNATSVIKSGTGNWILSGANTYTGATNVLDGTLIVTGSLAAGSVVTVNGNLAGTGNVAGMVNAGGGTLSPGVSGAGTLSTGTLILNSSSVLNFDLGTARDSIKVTGNLTLDGTLNVTELAGFGPGTYCIMTYSGTLIDQELQTGTMPADYNYSIEASGGSVRLIVSPLSSDYFWDVSTDAGIQAGNGTWGTNNYWTVDGTFLTSWPGAGNNATFAGSDGTYSITVNGTQDVDSITFSNNGYTLSGGTINLGTKNGIFTANGVQATINSVVNGSNGIAKYGAGELFLNGNNTFTGASIVSAGKLTLNHANALGAVSGGTTVANGASLLLRGSPLTYAAEPLTINGAGISYPGAIRTTVSSPGENVTWQGTVTLGSNSSIGATDADDQINITGVIGGAFRLTTDGPGSITLTGTNTFSGGLVINDGITKAGNTQALGDFGNTITVSSGAALDINGFDLRGYTQNIVINGQVDENTGAIINTGADQMNAIRQISLGSDASIGNNGNRFDIGRGHSGAVRVTGNNHILTKVGNNFVALMADATSLAGVIVNGGQLSLESDAAAGDAPVTINSGAILVSYGNRVFTNNITINNGGQLNSPGSNLYTTVHNGNISLSGNTTMHNAAANTMTIGGVISGNGNLTKTGAEGTIILSNTNTYTGAITVSEGTLIVDGSTSASSTVNISSGANLGGTGTVAGTVTIAGNGIISPGHGGAGTLRTGTLNLNNTSVLNYELGTSRDSIKVTGNLTLDGRLNITALDGFGTGSYTLMTCSGTITNNTMIVNNAPSGYAYSISVASGSVILTVTTAPQDTLILRYEFDESSGPVVFDSSDYENHGTAVNNPSFVSSFSGNSIALDGTDDYVQIPTGIVSSCNDITICTWVRLDTIIEWNRIFDFGNGTTTGYMFLAPAGGSLRFAITQTNNGNEQRVNAPMFSANVWKHVAVRIKGDSAQIYIDGVAAATSANITINPSDLGSTLYNYIGKSQFTVDPYLDGAVEDFRIYSYALTPADIASIYNSTRPLHFTWDTSPASEYQPANGTWGTDNYWSPDGYAVMPWPGAGASATFAGSDGTWTITVNGTQHVDSLTFNNGTYTITGGTALNFGTKSGVMVAAGKDAVINTVISSTPGVTKYGSGTLRLGGTNTYTGATIINEGTIFISTIANGGTNSNIGASAATAGNLVFRGGTLAYTGAGNGTNRLFTLDVNGGTIDASGTGTLRFTATGTMAFEGTGARTLILSGSNTGDNRLNIAINNDGGGNATSIIKTGTGKWILNGNNGATGTVTISNGTLQIGNGGTTGSIAGNVVNGGVLIFNRSDALSYSGNISSTGSVTKTGTGTLTLSGNNTFSGGVTISAGTLRAGSTSALGHYDNTITVSSGAALDINGYNLQNYTKEIILNGQVDASTGALINTGAVQQNAIGKVSLGSNTSIGNDGGNAVEIGRGIGGTVLNGNGFTLTKIGTNDLKLAGTGSGLASVIVNAGRLSQETADAFGNAPVIVNGGAVLSSYYSMTVANNITLNDQSTLRSSSNAAHVTEYTGTITTSGNDTLLNNGTNTVTLSGVIEGTGTIIKKNAGIFRLSNTGNTFSGGLTVLSGTLQIGADEVIPDGVGKGSVSVTGGTLDLNSHSETINGLSGSGTITSSTAGASTLAIGGNNATSSFDGVIQNGAGTVALTKTGTGTLTLAGVNTYTGATLVSAGTLNVTGSIASGSAVTVSATLSGDGTVAGTVNVSNGTIIPGNGGTGTLSTGTLTLNGSSTLNYEIGTSSDLIAITGDLVLDGKLNVAPVEGFGIGTYIIMTYSGSLTNQVLEINTAPEGYNYGITAEDGKVYLHVISTSTDWFWDVSTDASFQAGDGTWGIDNYWTTDGTHLFPWLRGDFSATFAGSDSTWTVTVNGTQNVDSLAFLNSGYTLTDGTLNFGTKPGVLVAAGKNATINSIISGSPGLSKYGTGILVLGGSNTYTGPTVINAGTISTPVISDGGSSSGIGASANTADNLVILGATLVYTGTGHSSDRLFTLGTAGGTISASGSGALNLSNTGSMAFSGAGTRTLILGGTNSGNNILAAEITNEGANATSVTKSGDGKWILTGNNTATGTVTISGGTLQIGNAGTSGSIAGNVANSGTLVFNRSDNYTYSKVISGAGAVIQAGSATLIFDGDNAYTGVTTISDGTLQIGDDGTTGSIAGDVVNNGSLVFYRSDEYSYSGIISGTGTVHKNGAARLILTGTNAYSGATVINSGTLSVNVLADGDSASNIGAAAATADRLIINGGTLEYTGAGSTSNRLFTIGTGVSGAAILASGTGELNLNGTGSLAFTGNGSRTLTLGGSNSGNNSLAVVIGDQGTNATSVTKTGTGKWILTGENTYTGITSISAGTLVIDGSTHAGSAVNVAAGATLAGSGMAGGNVTVANNGIIAPGTGTGTLYTGSLVLNNASVLSFDLGTARDSIRVVGNLTLDGILNITETAGFGPGTYTLIKYTGSLVADNGLEIGSVPDQGYIYSVTVNEGAKSVILSVVPGLSLKPITVVETAQRCSVYTDDWTLVFDNQYGGGIVTLTDAAHGESSGQGNQLGNGQNLYYFFFDGDNSKSDGKGTWSVLTKGGFFATIRQSGILKGLPYITDYTVHGSGKIYIRTSLENTGGDVSGKTVRCVVERRNVAAMSYHKGNDNASLSPYVLISSDSAKQNDILLSIKDLWNTSHGAANSATGFYSAAGSYGYENNNLSISTGQKQVWEFMLDFVHDAWNDTAGVGGHCDDYRSPDSLEMIAGTLLMEKAWEKQLRGHWQMDEGTGDTIRDNSGNNRHAHTTSQNWTNGRWGGALSFNGVNSAVYPDHSDFDGTDFFTVMAWIKCNNGTFTSGSVIAGKYTGGSGWKLTGSGSDRVTLTCNGTNITGTRDVGDGMWHHVAACYSKSKVMLYVDGRIDMISTGSFSVSANDEELVIGKGLTGTLDDVRFYHDYISENTLKAICQQGFRSSEGMYELRADNNSTICLKIDGGSIRRNFPVFIINNYWAESKPEAGCVVLNGTPLIENSDYFAHFDNPHNQLIIGLNKMITTDEARLYIDNDFEGGALMTGATKKMNWGIDNAGDYKHFWVKNFSENTFGSDSSRQWYLNWKMSTEGNSKDGELWFMSSSYSNPGDQVDTAANINIIPGADGDNDSWVTWAFNIGGQLPRSSKDVSGAFNWAVEESSSVRIRIRIDNRTVSLGGNSFDIKTRWTIYPTGQIFRWDSISNFSAGPSQVHLLNVFDDNAGFSSVSKSEAGKRAVLMNSQNYPDFASAWLSMKNNSGYQAEPFDNDTIDECSTGERAGFKYVDETTSPLTKWISAPIQTVQYLDIQRPEMSPGYRDSVCIGVQHTGLGNGDALIVSKGTLLSGELATDGDLNKDGFNETEGAYVIAAENNAVNFQLPANNDTCRFYPVFRLTDYFASSKPQYIFLYNSSGDTIPLLDGYQYNAYLNRAKRELVIQIDSVFCSTVGIFISADRTLAVTLSSFWAKGGQNCDTLGWRTESELENLGYYIYRRIKPEFYDSLSNLAKKKEANEGAVALLKGKAISSKDTGWVLLNNEIIPGAPSGVSHASRNYMWIDKAVLSEVLYEYKLVSVDYRNVAEEFGPVEAMPLPLIRVFRLGTNFPNPFRAFTVIRFELPVECRVSLNIYDLQGRLVRKLITPDKPLAADFHQVIWDGKNDMGRKIQAGPYIYRLTARKFTKSMVMIKVE